MTSDQQLLETLAGSVSAALENARLVHETRQRNAELALINSVQAAIAGELDPQAIYDLVGDKLQEVFDAQVVDIAIHDEGSGLLDFPYVIERGRRLDPQPIPLIGFRKHVMETREPLLLEDITSEVLERYGNPFVVSGEPSRSALFVPLVVGGRATGVFSLQNVDRDHAFSESDQQLLTTLAGSLSVALENARLVHETRQRNAELALINSVQAAIAGELDPQAIYDLVGDKLQEVFDAQVVDIAVYDEPSALLHFPYTIERGVRFPEETLELIGFRKLVMETREPLLIEEGWSELAERYGNPHVLSGEAPKSALFVPLVVGGRATGVISLQNVDRTHAFDEGDQRLLTTLAGSLSVALDNARLVHETRQRVAELGTVNSVGQALSSQLDLDALIELVGEQVRGTFEADIAYVALLPRSGWENRVRLLLRERRASTRGADRVRGEPHVTDPPLTRAAPPQPPGALRRPGERRDALSLLPRRADPRRQHGDRGDQRPEHRGGGPVRRGRLAVARDDRCECRRRDSERAPVHRGGAAARILGIARGDQPGSRDRDGPERGRHGVEPGGSGALRPFRRRGSRPARR